jgi:hypothetical protein
MSRGKQYKTKLKEAVLIAAGVAESIKLGEKRAEKKMHSTKPLMESAREHIGKMIDNVEIKIDPLELAAVVGVAFIIKNGINWAEGLGAGLGKYGTAVIGQLGGGIILPNPVTGVLESSKGLGTIGTSNKEAANQDTRIAMETNAALAAAKAAKGTTATGEWGHGG